MPVILSARRGSSGDSGQALGAACYLSSNATIHDGFVFQTLSWSGTVWDTMGMWSAAHASRLTAQRAGLYLLIAQFNIAAGPIGDAGGCIQRNGTGTVNSGQIGFGETQFGTNGNLFPALQVTMISQGVAGDYWEFNINKRETSGAGGDMVVDKGATFFQAQYLGST